MKNLILAAAAGALVMTAAVPALSQTPPAPAAKPAGGKINFTTSPISDIAKDPKAKAILEKVIPQISDYYDQIGGMTLPELIDVSQGALDQAKIKEMQAEYDKA